MPVVDVYNLDKKKVGSLELSDTIFDAEVREHLFHEVVRAQLAARRQGSAKTKQRAEVKYSGHKMWRQKGTGRARQGSRKAPHWVGGGTVHGPQPRDYSFKVNKRIRRLALTSALSRRQQEGRLVVLDDFALSEIKTKKLAEILGRFEAPKALIVDGANRELALSARNLEKADYLPVDGLNVYDILRHDHVLVTKDAVAAIERRLGK